MTCKEKCYQWYYTPWFKMKTETTTFILQHCLYICVCGFLFPGVYVHQRAGGWDDGVSHRVWPSSAPLGTSGGFLQVVLCSFNAAAHICSMRLEDVLWQVKLHPHTHTLSVHGDDNNQVSWLSNECGRELKGNIYARCFLLSLCASLYWHIYSIDNSNFHLSPSLLDLSVCPGVTLCVMPWTSWPSWRWFLKSSWCWRTL